MSNSIDWADLARNAASAGGGSFQPIPDGDYDMKVVEVESKTSTGGKQMFALKTQIQSGPHANRLVWDNLVVSQDSPTALGFFFRKMQALGLGQDFFATRPSNDQIVAGLQGRSFRAQIGSREWNGSPKNEIKNYYPSSATTPGAPSGPPVPQPPAAAPVAAPPAPPAPQQQQYAAPVQQPPAPPQTAPQAPSPWENQQPPAPAFNLPAPPPF
jgi:hypothetical protein